MQMPSKFFQTAFLSCHRSVRKKNRPLTKGRKRNTNHYQNFKSTTLPAAYCIRQDIKLSLNRFEKSKLLHHRQKICLSPAPAPTKTVEPPYAACLYTAPSFWIAQTRHTYIHYPCGQVPEHCQPSSNASYGFHLQSAKSLF